MNLDKSHVNDAFVIAGGTFQERIETCFAFFKRKNNRKLQISRKGHKRSIRRKRHEIQPHAIVRYGGKIYKALSTHSGGISILLTNGFEKINRSKKKVNLIFNQGTLIFSQ